ncbi:MAG: RagB/SusD family nutrient uptake outer membrane protein [Flavisolibacter sp.]
MKGKIITIMLFGVFLISINSCTKLDSKVYDQTTTFFTNPAQIAAGVAPAYLSLQGLAPTSDIYNLQEVTSDEVVVPTRGSDWFDNGNWQRLWLHTWTPADGAMNGAWEFIYGGIARVNLILQQVAGLTPQPTDIASINAELKTIRAYYYFLAMDMFGNVPVVSDYQTDLTKVAPKSRAEVFAFVEKELLANVAALPEKSNSTYGRMTKWFGYSLLAKLYLNAGVYIGAPRWADVITNADMVIKSGKYSLEGNFFDNFTVNNQGSNEAIFNIPMDVKKGIGGFGLQMATLHYQSNETFGILAGPWNGFCSTADYYNQFDSVDKRKNMFLVGQQYDLAGKPQIDKQVNLPLNFDPNVSTISSPAPLFRMAGVRCHKYEYTKDTWGAMDNDWVVLRLSDVYLMRGEAKFRAGVGDLGLSDFNAIRARAGVSTWTAADLTLPNIEKERARELSWEASRRTDMIRFGDYINARVPDKAISGSFRTLFPIPKPQIDKNANLKQNPGY